MNVDCDHLIIVDTQMVGRFTNDKEGSAKGEILEIGLPFQILF